VQREAAGTRTTRAVVGSPVLVDAVEEEEEGEMAGGAGR